MEVRQLSPEDMNILKRRLETLKEDQQDKLTQMEEIDLHITKLIDLQAKMVKKRRKSERHDLMNELTNLAYAIQKLQDQIYKGTYTVQEEPNGESNNFEQEENT